MQDTAKYLIHADITAEGVVERSDVVGAIFGQTEGLLGDELDLRDLQDSSKVGRIDVEINSENGQSFGTLTIASGLDQVETAILGAALETIERVGPCRAAIEVSRIEDVRAAKRRVIVDRAKELLGEAFDGSMLTSQELVEEVRRSIRIEDITEYEGLPAGPRIPDSDAIIVVEGRSDVLTLLRYGIKNAVAVEGTNVPASVADLTRDRTVTAFLDGDRGGDLILKELEQIGEVDYIASAPAGRSVEDLDRGEVMRALREKVPYETAVSATNSEPDADRLSASDGGSAALSPEPATGESPTSERPVESAIESIDDPPDAEDGASSDAAPPDERSRADSVDDASSAADGVDEGTDAAASKPAPEPETLREHVERVVGEGSGRVRLLDGGYDVIADGEADDAFGLVESAATVPAAVVVDGAVTQRLLDVAAQRGVDQIVGRATDEFVKRPTGVRIRTADQLLARDRE
jgi:DNA primase